MNRAWIALKSLRQLGVRPIFFLARYRLGLASGRTAQAVDRACARAADARSTRFRPLLWLPGRDHYLGILGHAGLALLKEGADQVVAGQACLFGGTAQPLNLTPNPPLRPWTAYEDQNPEVDMKAIWEPARFGWTFTLGRGYLATGDPQYAQAFWDGFDVFQQANPACLGPNWVSAQEVALRLIAFVFSAQVFAGSPRSTPPRMQRLLQAIAVHAARIPPTLPYALAQDNNHLISEAVALYTAGLALPAHPAAPRWRKTGWRLFHSAIQRQIAADGTYTQNSSNYHRLMLQLALWMLAASESVGVRFPEKTLARLASATHWIFDLHDPISGRVPNLGPNDGAYIFPLSACSYNDYRPVLASAMHRFLDESYPEHGPWDEMPMWLSGKPRPSSPTSRSTLAGEQLPRSQGVVGADLSPHILRLPGSSSWAYLRIARFTARPGHADQLHLDLWWRGENLTLDAGTYLYTAPEPWDNTLSRTLVHNTLVVSNQDQMVRAGRFLWLDWAQARLQERQADPEGTMERLVASHDGYRRQNVIHRRTVTAHQSGEWEILDELLPLRAVGGLIEGTLQWLLPDWSWEAYQPDLNSFVLRLRSPHGWVHYHVSAQTGGQDVSPVPPPDQSTPSAQFSLCRAGQAVWGDLPVLPYLGWYSPTYASRLPALSLRAQLTAGPPIIFVTRIMLPPLEE